MKDDLISRQAAIDLAPGLIVPNEYKYSIYNQAINNYCVEIMQLPSAQIEQQWIPCSERLPEVGEEVLVCYDFKGHRSVYIANFYGDGEFSGYDDEYLTPDGRKYRKTVAWMPLPEPYRESKK